MRFTGTESGLSEGSRKEKKVMRIDSDLFEAYLRCPVKCFLRAQGEQAVGNACADWVRERR